MRKILLIGVGLVAAWYLPLMSAWKTLTFAVSRLQFAAATAKYIDLVITVNVKNPTIVSLLIEKLTLNISINGEQIGKTFITNFHLPGRKTSPAPIYVRVDINSVAHKIWYIISSGDLLGTKIGLQGSALISGRPLPLSVEMYVGELAAHPVTPDYVTVKPAGVTGNKYLRSLKQTQGFAKQVLRKLKNNDYNFTPAESRMYETLKRTGWDAETAAMNYWNRAQAYTRIGALSDLGHNAEGIRRLKDTADKLIAKQGNINYDVFSDGAGTFAVTEPIQEAADLNNWIFSSKKNLRKAIRASKAANNAIVHFDDIDNQMGELITPKQIFNQYHETFGQTEYAKDADQAYIITLYNIANGLKFTWAKVGTQEGIADIFGYTATGKNFRSRNYNTPEKKYYKGIIDQKNGISPAKYAENITDYDVDNTGEALAIRDAAYEAIKAAPSRDIALNLLVRAMPVSEKKMMWLEAQTDEDVPF
ncbi:MAG: LEA type 2 family protein [Prevotellaceae bacterium]|jgi:LEA14-like dessication related protein|nr:LEA type 2 family protein [Prevotellaceae bacterium]